MKGKGETGWRKVSSDPFETKTDDEGLYNLYIPVELPPNAIRYRVGIGTVPTDEGHPFAYSPYSFYSSTATYSLVLDPINGEKLVDENFDSHEYKIKVSTAVFAEQMSASTSGLNGYVWGVQSDGSQYWISASSLSISTASTSNIGGIHEYKQHPVDPLPESAARGIRRKCTFQFVLSCFSLAVSSMIDIEAPPQTPPKGHCPFGIPLWK